MKNEKKQEWIVKGYELAARYGLKNIGVESISRSMSKSKSSFYNYFGEMDNFIDALYSHHLAKAELFANDISKMKEITPGLIDILIKYKTDVFFHKQLYLHKEKIHCKDTIEKVLKLYSKSIEEKWIPYFGLINKTMFIKRFHKFITEHFLLMIHYDNYSYTWIENYLKELTIMLGLLSKD